MAEVSRSQTLRDNERLKHLASAITAWANALVIGGFTKMSLEQVLSLAGFLMVIGGCVMVWLSSLGLTMLTAEGEI